VPGVVAVAATDKDVLCEGAFDKRDLAASVEMTNQYNLSFGLDDQGGYFRRSARCGTGAGSPGAAWLPSKHDSANQVSSHECQNQGRLANHLG
jgi:hypothetical protein